MPRSFWIAISLLIIGFVLVLLPDKGEAILQFNEAHGPSLIDLIGLGFFSIGWIWMTTYAILQWRKITIALGASKLLILLLMYIGGIVLIIFGLKNGNEILLWMGIISSVFSNAVVFYQAFKIG